MLPEPGLLVLLIEDEPDALTLVNYALAKWSDAPVAVEWAGDLGTGLERLAERNYHAVLLDLNLPDSGGFDTFARVREKAIDAAVIVLTGQEDETLALQAVRAGADDYLMKSDIRDRVLSRRIRYAVERHRLKRRQAEDPAKNGKIFTFLGAKGGSGTSTLVVNIAAALAKAGQRTIAIELMPEFSSFTGLLNCSPSWDISTLLGGAPGTISRDDVASCLEDLGSGFRVLCGPRRAQDYRPVSLDEARTLLTLARSLADYTVVDMPSIFAPSIQEVVRQSALTTMVVELSPMGLCGASTKMPALQALAARPGAVNAILIDKTPSSESVTPAEFSTRLGCGILGVVSPAADLQAGAEPGALTVLSRPDAPYSKSIQEIAWRLSLGAVPGMAA
ncbi:MAG: response regulator [Bryobacteraceae bacterium]|jgi:Flp pilus assembly CpaE family ATPase